MNLKEMFDKYEDDYLKFCEVSEPVSLCRDLCGLMTLDRLQVFTKGSAVSASEHDEFFLSADCEKLADVATEDDIRTLLRCGVRYSEEYDCLSVFS